VDLAGPEWHGLARDAKDLAAGAVLILAIAAVVVGLLVFLPYL
jgi:diacylglycerol kinase